MTVMDLKDVQRIVQKARDESETPDLSETDLSRANLHGADLRGADMYGANLHMAKLRGANLSGANLHGADLYGAELRGANLYEANLYGANLYDASGWDGLQITGLHNYQIQLTPTHEGWSITIGCWTGTPDELTALIALDDGWPESTVDKIPQNRALLEAALTVIRAHITAHPDAVKKATTAQREWETKETQL